MKSALDECMKKLVKVGTHRNVDCTYVGHSFFKRSRIYSFNKSFILRNICASVEKSNVLMLLHEKTDYE
jgi:lipid A disaccharide synthetase